MSNVSSNGLGSPPVQLSGLASGIDTKGIVSGLVAAESIPMQQMQKDAAQLRAAVGDVSAVSTALAALKTASDALSQQVQVGSFTASSSDTSIAPTALPTAQAGSYAVSVATLAQEQRTYSSSFADHATALGQSGTFTIQVGNANAATITVKPTDSLDSIASQITAAGVRAGASVFFDGTNYRLQIRGLDTGVANKLTMTESGTTLDLNGNGGTPSAGRTAQVAQDASGTVDGFAVSSSTNQFVGVIPGVTLAVTKTTSSPATVTVATDPNSLATKLTAFVNAYNTVITDIHKISGYGSNKAMDPTLAGNSSLRAVADKLASTFRASYGTGKYDVLATIGVKTNSDGSVTLDSAKLTTAFNTSPAAVESLLGRAQNASTGGAMATFGDAVKALTDGTNGVLTLKTKQLNDQATLLDKRVTSEQTRIAGYQLILQAQFSAMETAYSKNQSLIAQLSKI